MRFPAYQFIFQNALYPLYNRIKGRDIYGFARERIRTEKLSAAELRELQFNKLQEILKNAHKHVPFYKEKFDALGFKPKQLRSLEDFEKIDFYVTKEDVRRNPSSFISSKCNQAELNWHFTGGSTGEPLLFATDHATDAASGAAMVRALRWWGAKLGEPHAIFWGSPTYIVRRPMDRVKKIGVSVRDSLMNRLYISNYNLNEKNMSRYRDKLESFKPGYVRGMPSSLYVFARWMLENGRALSEGSPKFIHSACEQLYDWQRETIEEGFRAPVVNTYGLSELGDIAFEGRCRNLHIMDEDVLIETKECEGGRKEIIATQLNNLSSPLIRYRTRDVVDRVSGCDCGLGLGVLNGLKGRSHDFIVAPDGRFLHGQLFTHLIVYESGVKSYQIRQLAIDQIAVRLVIDESYNGDSEYRLRKLIQNYMGSEVTVTFNYVDKIELTSAGKHRWIISDVSQ